ncbi:hypothetical protein [Coleofasciculus sp.]|uniref:hypothetical protein n=1 Tax=Coleofasciculus sp. TaxID=3100458 RepID=UPI003A12B1FF
MARLEDEGGLSNIRVAIKDNSQTRPYTSVRAGFEQTLLSTAKRKFLNPPLQTIFPEQS